MGWNYISPEGRENVKAFKYCGEDHSLIYKYLMSPLAAYLVENWTPRWVAYVAAPRASCCVRVYAARTLPWVVVSVCSSPPRPASDRPSPRYLSPNLVRPALRVRAPFVRRARCLRRCR
jgi:hypothetical protein